MFQLIHRDILPVTDDIQDGLDIYILAMADERLLLVNKSTGQPITV